MRENSLTIVVCVMGVLTVAYGMLDHNNPVFIIGLLFVIGGYFRIRKKLKESSRSKN